MSYSDDIIAQADASVDDEFERQMLHKSSTVTVKWMSWAILVTAAMLAWVLDGLDTLWTALIFPAPLVASWIGLAWLRKSVPAPRPVPLSRIDWIALIFIIVIWLAGIAVKGFGSSLAFTVGAAVGAILGLLAAVFLASRIPARQRRKDIQRLNDDAEAEDT
ncbi:hypothetical protein CATRI_04740 [Corynebacterium atrinae]|uniref:hypothetical protein n=1 Tax=Corynebacterium atrinae TaxID=1336740 RepID=UPI0025B572AF|nr:hypothetical protein [Corynebacterium atrinae]WJY63041.1 hypothetical protein CATRI_04740 [Corynebacterium atrinae]